MTLFSTTYNYIILSLLAFALFLATYLFLNYKTFKKKETQKLAMIFDAIAKEKEITATHKKTSKTIKQLQTVTQTKLLTIKLKIVNLDFTLEEIFNLK